MKKTKHFKTSVSNNTFFLTIIISLLYFYLLLYEIIIVNTIIITVIIVISKIKLKLITYLQYIIILTFTETKLSMLS